MSTPLINYKRHRFSPEIIAHAVWLDCRFNLSFREVEELFLERGRRVLRNDPPVGHKIRAGDRT